MATNKQEQAKAIYEIWDVILQHRWRFVLPAFGVMALVLFASLLLPRKYEASAYFERSNDPVLIEAIRTGASESYMDPMASLQKELAGSHAIANVVEKLKPRLMKVGYIENETELHKLRSTVKQRLIVNREYADKTRIQLRIELVLDDPNVAALVVNALVDRYIERTRAQLIDRVESSIAYYDNLIHEHRVVLEEKQEQLGIFEQKHAMLLPEHPFSIQSQTNAAKDELSRLNTELEGVDFRRRTLREAIQEEPATMPSIVRGPNPERVRLQLKLEQLQESIQDQLTKMRKTEQHPEVVALRQQESELQERIDGTEQTIVTATQSHPNPKRAELELELTRADSERAALEKQIAIRRTKIEELSEMSVEMLPVRKNHEKLQAEVATARKYVDNYENIRFSAENFLTPESGDRGVQLEFIRRAEPVKTPVSPAVAQVVLVACFLGIAAGALSVFLAHRTDESFRNARQLSEATTIPLLGSVSELITNQHRRMRRFRYSVVYPMNAAVMASILLLFAGLLYVDLERPDVMNQLKTKAKSLVQIAPQQPSEPPPTIGMTREPNNRS